MRSMGVLLSALMFAASMSGCIEDLSIGESTDESGCNNDVCVPPSLVIAGDRCDAVSRMTAPSVDSCEDCDSECRQYGGW